MINPITGATSSTFTVTGQLTGFSTAPALAYEDDPGLPAVTGIANTPSQTSIALTWIPDVDPAFVPLVGTVTTTSFSFVHPAMSAGTHTLLVTSGTVTGQTTYSVVGGSAAISAWNPADADPGITISGTGNLIATVTTQSVGGSTTSVRSTTSKTTGKLICEIIGIPQDSGSEMGFANATMKLNIFQGMGEDINGVGINLNGGDQGVLFNGVKLLTGNNTENRANCPVTMCLDIPNLLFWFTTAGMRTAVGASAWNNNASANPGTGVGGLSLAGMTGPFFICFNGFNLGEISQLNPAGPFAVAIPSGFTAWDASTVAPVLTIAVQTPSGPFQENTAFAVAGSLSGYSIPPSLEYSDDGVTFTNLSGVGGSITTSTYGFTHPGLATPGTYNISVRDASNPFIEGASGTYTVQAPVVLSPVISSLSTPSNILPSAAFTVPGTLANYSSPPTLEYLVNREGSLSSWLPAGVATSTSAFTVTVPGQASPGVYSISVRDAGTPTNSLTTSTFIITNGTILSSLGLQPIGSHSGNPLASSVNILIVGDGFLSSDDALFFSGATSCVNAILAFAPYSSNANKMNFFALYAHSLQSGSSLDVAGGTPGTVNNYFGSEFVTEAGEVSTAEPFVQDPLIAYELAREWLPEYNAILVICKTQSFGGVSDFGLSVVTLKAGFNAAYYELGHSVFGLSDEFGFSPNWTGGPYPGAFGLGPRNVISSQSQMPALWTALVTPGVPLPTVANTDCSTDTVSPGTSPFPASTVGMFEGAAYFNCGLYRSQAACQLRYGGTFPFCAVCTAYMNSILASA